MLQCKSMYFAGNIVDAVNIDSYEDYKRLGLVCPYCNEAVFFRKAVTLSISDAVSRDRQPCFVHYKGGHPCELRSRTTKGQQEIEDLRIESRNQRLKLYNLYLWDILKSDIEIDKSTIYKTLKMYRRKDLNKFIDIVIENWGTVASYKIKNIEDMANTYFKYCLNDINAKSDTTKHYIADRLKYFNNSKFDSYAHNSIFIEVLQYLSTPTGTFVLKKLIQHTIVAGTILENEDKYYYVPINIRDSATVFNIVNCICSVVYGKDWLVQINKRLVNQYG